MSISHSIHLHESYGKMELRFDVVRCNQFQCSLQGDLKGWSLHGNSNGLHKVLLLSQG